MGGENTQKNILNSILKIVSEIETGFSFALGDGKKVSFAFNFEKPKGRVRIEIIKDIIGMEYSDADDILRELSKKNRYLNIFVDENEFNKDVGVIIKNMFKNKPTDSFIKGVLTFLRGYGRIYKTYPDLPLYGILKSIDVDTVAGSLKGLIGPVLPVEDDTIPFDDLIGGMFPEGFKVGLGVADLDNKVIGSIIVLSMDEKGVQLDTAEIDVQNDDLANLADTVRKDLSLDICLILSEAAFSFITTLRIDRIADILSGQEPSQFYSLLPVLSKINGLGFGISPDILQFIGELPPINIERIDREALNVIREKLSQRKYGWVILENDEIYRAFYISMRDLRVKRIDTSLSIDGVSIKDAFKNMNIDDATKHLYKVLSKEIEGNWLCISTTREDLRKALRPFGEIIHESSLLSAIEKSILWMNGVWKKRYLHFYPLTVAVKLMGHISVDMLKDAPKIIPPKKPLKVWSVDGVINFIKSMR